MGIKILDGFKIARFLFGLQAIESGRLPEYKGGLLRGGFGYVFKSLACLRKQENCLECKDKGGCPYHYIFDTTPTKEDDKFSAYSDVPRPFIIESGSYGRSDFARGDHLHFGLVLIGRAIEYFPYFVFCFDELGRRGMGRGKVRFRLEEVLGFNFQNRQWFPVYDSNTRLLTNSIPSTQAEKLWPIERHSNIASRIKTLNLEFLTPTRIKYRDKHILYLEFHIMIRNLLRRVSMLKLFHSEDASVGTSYADSEVGTYINQLISEAQMVEIQNWDLRWQDWERYSTRKERDIKLGGFAGNITYIGDMDKFMPFVALGEHIHIGKNTTFGFGQYYICDERRNLWMKSDI